MRSRLAATLLVLVGLAHLAQAQPCGIFVAPFGADSATSRLDPADPCLTISRGIARTVAEGLDRGFVQAGNRDGVVVLQDGVDVLGGQDTNWREGAHDGPADR